MAEDKEEGEEGLMLVAQKYLEIASAMLLILLR